MGLRDRVCGGRALNRGGHSIEKGLTQEEGAHG